MFKIIIQRYCVINISQYINFSLYRTLPAPATVFKFDQTLIEDKDTLGNKLQPNALTVDNLTVDWLRTKLNDLENSLKECQEKQNKVAIDNSPSSKSPPSPILNGTNGTNKDVNK